MLKIIFKMISDKLIYQSNKNNLVIFIRMLQILRYKIHYKSLIIS